MRMTLREVQISLRYIGIRTHNNFAMQANMWGAKIPMRKVEGRRSSSKTKPDPKMDAKIRAMQKERFDKQREINRGKHGGLGSTYRRKR